MGKAARATHCPLTMLHTARAGGGAARLHSDDPASRRGDATRSAVPQQVSNSDDLTLSARLNQHTAEYCMQRKMHC